jgi:hypothetical protein
MHGQDQYYVFINIQLQVNHGLILVFPIWILQFKLLKRIKKTRNSWDVLYIRIYIYSLNINAIICIYIYKVGPIDS